jgi:hypothetical protein
MNDRERLEQEIRDLLTADLSSVEFSNRVFGQFHGLFPRLGPTEAERRVIVQSELWKQAQDRVRELERQELERRRPVRPAARPEPADAAR